MIGDIRTFQIVSSIKQHFLQDRYDYTKYRYNSKKYNETTFSKRNEKALYYALGKRFDKESELELFCACNYFYQPDMWVGNLLEQSADDNYIRAMKVKQAAPYYVVEDVKNLIDKHGSFTNTFDGKIFDEIVAGNVHPETFILINKICHIENKTNKLLSHVIYETVIKRLNKYSSFVVVPTTQTFEEIRNGLKQLKNRT